jgi:large exoprotein involved in heme utilization and adhesion
MPNKNKPKVKPVRVNVSAVKLSSGTRTDCAQVVGTNGPSSAIWQTVPEVQLAGTKLVAAGTALAAADAAVQSLASQLATAQNVRDAKSVEFDAAFGVYVANVEAHATTPQDVTGLGLALFAKSTYVLAAPIGIEAAFDAAKGQIQLRVNKAPGMHACVVEVSSNSADPAAWQRLPGVGALHKLSGYAAGTYWARAASARANEMSDFTEPVPVIVK